MGRGAMALSAASMVVSVGTSTVRAHAFGARYDLPLPLDYYLAGAGGAVALSFVIMALAFRARPGPAHEPETDRLDFRLVRMMLHPAVIAVLQIVSVSLFVAVLAAGLFGNQDTIRNLAPTFVWVIWWVGFAYVVALVGNIWPVLNPWSIVFAGFERAARRPLALGLAYPPWLGVWPAVLLFGLFAWFELISETSRQPDALAVAIIVYSCITWIGMAVFGRKVWLAHGEAFSLAFDVLGRFAPLGGPQPEGGRHVILRSYAAALVVREPRRLSMTAFILLMLSTVTFDGLKETPLWGDLLQWMARVPWFHPVIRRVHDLGFDFHAVLATAMLVLFPLLFLAVFLGFSRAIRWAARDKRDVTEIAGLFVYSLVPIAIAYHLAHYFSYLLVGGQLIIPLASDPLGLGWNLFGTVDYVIDIGVTGAKQVWYTAVVAIVAGHVFAVGVAHLVALRVFETAGSAIRSQYPLLVLMVGYTMVSLWILSQPIVGSANPNTLPAPSDTVTLAPFQFREFCLDLDVGDEIKYDFRSDQKVEFDLHYSHGLALRFAIKKSGISGHAGQFTAPSAQLYCLLWMNRSLVETSVKYRVMGP